MFLPAGYHRNVFHQYPLEFSFRLTIWGVEYMQCRMMTSSNGNIFRVTGLLYGEFTGHRWIPHTKASDAELDVFFGLRLNQQLRKLWTRRWFATLSCSLWRYRNGLTTHFEDRVPVHLSVSYGDVRQVTCPISSCTHSYDLASCGGVRSQFGPLSFCRSAWPLVSRSSGTRGGSDLRESESCAGLPNN